MPSLRHPRVLLITCQRLPEPDPDQGPLLEALRERGLEARLLAWDAAGDVPDAEAAVLRSCWNYYEDPPRFLAWVEALSRRTRLHNPLSCVRWNLHKGYLSELEAAGIPIVATEWFRRGESTALADVLRRRGWRKAVVKPAISAASFQTRAFEEGDPAGEAFLAAALQARDTLVQEYVESVHTEGESALVWIDGAFTHQVKKTPRFAGQDERVSGARALAPEELAFGGAVLRLLPAGLLYARVDVVRDAAGGLRLSELEILEPSLFLVQSPAALERFAAAIERRAREPASGGLAEGSDR
jgi:hypothetical protein